MDNENKLNRTLIDLGLSENEAKTYLTSLLLGPASVLKISREANMNRTTLYGVIDSLKHKGLMNIEIKGMRKLYMVEDPERLDHILDIKKEQLKKVLPEFSTLFNLRGEESSVKYYEGLEATKMVYDQILDDLKPKEFYYAISDTKKWQAPDYEYFERFKRRRAKLNINIRLLLQDSKIARENKKIARNLNSEIKILPSKTSLITNLVVVPHYIIIHQLTPPLTSIVIKNLGAVQMGKQLFEIIWNSIDE